MRDHVVFVKFTKFSCPPGSKPNIMPGELACKRAEGEPTLHLLLYRLIVIFLSKPKGKMPFYDQ